MWARRNGSRAAALSFVNRRATRLAAQRHPESIRHKNTSFAWPGLAHGLRSGTERPDAQEPFRYFMLGELDAFAASCVLIVALWLIVLDKSKHVRFLKQIVSCFVIRPNNSNS